MSKIPDKKPTKETEKSETETDDNAAKKETAEERNARHRKELFGE